MCISTGYAEFYDKILEAAHHLCLVELTNKSPAVTETRSSETWFQKHPSLPFALANTLQRRHAVSRLIPRCIRLVLHLSRMGTHKTGQVKPPCFSFTFSSEALLC